MGNFREGEPIPICLLIGEGSRLGGLFDAVERGETSLEITTVISHKALKNTNPPQAVYGIERARQLGIPTDHWNYTQMSRLQRAIDPNFDGKAFRREFSKLLGLHICQKYPVRPLGIAMIGWRIVLTAEFLRCFPGPEKGVYNIINLHPALMPDDPKSAHYTFPDGYKTLYIPGNKEQVIEGVFKMGLRRYGTTLHYVTDSIDRGPILQRAVIDIENDTLESYEEKLKRKEVPMVEFGVRMFGEGRITVENGRVKVL